MEPTIATRGTEGGLELSRFRDWIKASAYRIGSLRGLKVDWRLSLIDLIVERLDLTSAGARYVALTVCYIKHSGLFKEPVKYTTYEGWKSLIGNASPSVFALILETQLDALDMVVDPVLFNKLGHRTSLERKIKAACASHGLEIADPTILASLFDFLQPMQKVSAPVQTAIDEVGRVVAEEKRIRREEEQRKKTASALTGNRDVMNLLAQHLDVASLAMFNMGAGKDRALSVEKEGATAARFRDSAFDGFAPWQVEWVDASAKAMKIDPMDVYKHLLRLRRHHNERFYVVMGSTIHQDWPVFGSLADLLFLKCVYMLSSKEQSAEYIRSSKDLSLTWPESELKAYPVLVPTESALLSKMPSYESGSEGYPASDRRSIINIVKRIAEHSFDENAPFIYTWLWYSSEPAVYFCCTNAAVCQTIAALERLYSFGAYKKRYNAAHELGGGFMRGRLKVHARVDLTESTVQEFLNARKRRRVSYLRFGMHADLNKMAHRMQYDAEEPLIGYNANLSVHLQ